jgi:hypothetical protein
MVLANDRPVVLSDSTLLRNEHAGSRFAYNVTLDRVLLVGHRGAGWTGLRTTDATVRVSAP